MVLFLITGELGSGKTLTLTYLAFKNWLLRKQVIFSNYHLYGFPYIEIDSVRKLDIAYNGFVAGDEFWQNLDARTSTKTKNRVTASILLRSRKRGLNYTFTAQLLDLLDKRVRKILDYTAYPMLNNPETICKVVVFRGGYPKVSSYLKTFYFRTAYIFEFFDTNEEVIEMEDDYESKEPLDVKIVYYPDKYSEPQVKVVRLDYFSAIEYIKKKRELPPEILKAWNEFDKIAEKPYLQMIKKGIMLW